jgi:hypothetical protein
MHINRVEWWSTLGFLDACCHCIGRCSFCMQQASSLSSIIDYTYCVSCRIVVRVAASYCFVEFRRLRNIIFYH